MNVTTNTTITCNLENGSTVTLTADDCASIINALARRHLLMVLVESMPADMADVGSDECCAWTGGDNDEEVVLSVDASDYVFGTPRKLPKAKPAKRKKKSAR